MKELFSSLKKIQNYLGIPMHVVLVRVYFAASGSLNSQTTILSKLSYFLFLPHTAMLCDTHTSLFHFSQLGSTRYRVSSYMLSFLPSFLYFSGELFFSESYDYEE